MPDIMNDLKVSEFSIEPNGHGSTDLVGIVENVSQTLYHFVEVQFNAYDNEGYQVDSPVTSVNNLEPQGKWKFSAPISAKGTSAKLIRIVADNGEKEESAVYT